MKQSGLLWASRRKKNALNNAHLLVVSVVKEGHEGGGDKVRSPVARWDHGDMTLGNPGDSWSVHTSFLRCCCFCFFRCSSGYFLWGGGCSGSWRTYFFQIYLTRELLWDKAAVRTFKRWLWMMPWTTFINTFLFYCVYIIFLSSTSRCFFTSKLWDFTLTQMALIVVRRCEQT